MNKGGWIRIVEAFIAILLIAGVLVFLISKGYVGGPDNSEKVYEIENAVLYEIQLDETLRAKILSVSIPFDVPETDSIRQHIDNRIPGYLYCEAKICELNQICALDNYPQQDVYAQSIAITASLADYKPRQLKLFCWEK